MARIGSIVVAAGASTRLGDPTPKQFQRLVLEPVFVLAARPLVELSDEVVVVVGAERVEAVRKSLADAGLASAAGATISVVEGGPRRQDSVALGLAALSRGIDVVLVHDGARPFATLALARRVADAALETGAAVPAVAVPDTVKRIEGSGDRRRVLSTLDRSLLGLTQTPQGFRREIIEDAYAALGDLEITDDAAAVELAGGEVAVVDGEPGNRKITLPSDLAGARLRENHRLGLDARARVGTGSDCHRLVPGRRLILCGVDVPFEKGLAGHSDADVATHAVCDALLGAVAQGDIGRHFPPGDPETEGISSLVLLERVARIVEGRGCEVGSVDVTIVAEAPVLAPHIDGMRRTLADVLGADVDCVSVKATTTEGTGPEGRGEAISAIAVAVVREIGGPGGGAGAVPEDDGGER